MSEIKQYDTEVRLDAVMGTNHYGVHIHAMTAENLHSKSDIAVELAWRDLRIEQLIAQLEAAQKERDVYANLASDVGDIITLLQNNEWAEQVGKTNVGGLLEYQITQLVNSIADINTKLLAAEVALSAANEKPIQITLGAGDVMISHIKWPDAQGISFAPMPTGYTGIGLNVDEQVSGKNSGEIGANVIIKSSSIESLKVLRDIVLIAIAGFTVEGE
ncbi:TPA: hypothetical protein ACQ9T4_004270 [Yersinia enterocolitica]